MADTHFDEDPELRSSRPNRLCDLSAGQRSQICISAWNHTYSCTCRTCQGAWALMGPDGMEKGNWGPFKEDDMRAFCEEEGVPFIEGE